MAAVSQALIDFANGYRQQPGPGVEVIVTPRYQVTMQPDFPIPGPNNISWIRCLAEEADEVIREARAAIAPWHVAVMWQLDPGTEPPDFAARLAAHGVLPDRHPDADVMVLPAEAVIQAPPVPGLDMVDALSDLETFREADAAAQEAFQSEPLGDGPRAIATQERRRTNSVASGNRYRLLARVDGEAAGTAAMSVFPPNGAAINGGAVRPKFRGRGVYRALVVARLEIARRAGVAGLSVWGGPMSAPILARLGFQKVGWRRMYIDRSTA